MNMPRHTMWAAVLAAALVTSACSGDDDGAGTGPPASGAPVPDSAYASPAAFLDLLVSLRTDDEASEPNTLGSTGDVPEDETSEPRVL